ncbi:DsbC family protein [Croceicoccus bisphenolivorans]|uniref:DsbC family protein n=1 Tax=Croceicoccus bisphenolivorans TaxID=1783232 RepID=UPI000833DDE2|nr:DsbC family protein [Croceicoccus bisphenolivorans]
MLGGSRWTKPTAATLAVLALSGATGWGVASFAQGTSAATTEAVKEALKVRLPKTAIDAIVCKGLGGLCEVASKQTLFYVDKTARYLVIGRVYDMETRQDLTAARLLELNPDLLAAGAARRSEADSDNSSAPTRAAAAANVDLSKLSDKGAIHWGPKDGPRVMVFSDFHCGYCKKLEAELKAIGARVEERPISIFGAESRKLAEQVLCARRPDVSLRMAYAGVALATSQPCDVSGLDENEAFARAHGFGGTPVLVRPSDGAVLEGYRPAEALRAFLTATPKTR